MSYFQGPPDALDERLAQEPEQVTMEPPEVNYRGSMDEQGLTAQTEPRASVSTRMAEFRERITRALAGFDRGYESPRDSQPGELDADGYPVQATEAFDVLGEVPARTDGAPRFALGPFGYNRSAVDEHIAALERELAEIRGQSAPPEVEPAISITEEIERLGEQTASILVVAHDQAHETTRLAQEQAERCVSDAADNAVAITEQAKRQLQALDMETDTVWQERARLLEDARTIGNELIALIDRAEARFPEDLKTADVEGARRA